MTPGTGRPLSEIEETRRKNLVALIEQWNGATPLAKKLNCTPGWISALVNRHRAMSEKQARKWETALTLPAKWLDTPHSEKGGGYDEATLRQVLLAITEAQRMLGSSLPAAATADIVVIVYEHAVSSGAVDASLVQRLIRLASR